AASPAWSDPDHDLAWRVVADPTWLCGVLEPQMRGATGTPWAARWRNAEEKAQRAIAAALEAHGEPTEPGTARALLSALPDGAALVVSSSMPVRDVEWYGAPRHGVQVLSNRGANGIDGVVSTAVGVALTGMPTALLIGDVALMHDSNGLIGAVQRVIDLVVVVIDNDGGGIFSFLPQATQVDAERFDQLFGTPHGVDLVALALGLGIDAMTVDEPAVLSPSVNEALGRGGVHLLRVRTDRATNVTVHDAIHRAVHSALS
ncbi:MAG TPA: thiamine pyrophosphate-dependent enzyme, partial [Acidimicrobiales bacterium]